jgi:hypothetical protein
MCVYAPHMMLGFSVRNFLFTSLSSSPPNSQIRGMFHNYIRENIGYPYTHREVIVAVCVVSFNNKIVIFRVVLYLCLRYDPHKKVVHVCLYRRHCLFFLMEERSVLCEVRNEASYKTDSL